MPLVVSTMVEAAPEEFRQAVALPCLSPLGEVGCQLEAVYLDGNAHAPLFQIIQNDYGVEVQPRYEMDLSYVNKRLAEWCAEQTALAKSHNSHTRWVFHKRCAVMGFRVAILVHFLWGESADEAVRGNRVRFSGKTVATSNGMKRVYEKIKLELSVMEE